MATGLPKHFPVAVNHSATVAFLTRLPRWPGAGNATTFDLNIDYLLPTALSALIPVIAGIVITAILFIALLLRMGRRRHSVDAALVSIAENPRDYIWQIPISVVLAFGIASFVAQGCIGAGVMLRSLRDALDVIGALFTTVQQTGFQVVDLFIMFVEKLKQLDPSSPEVAKIFPNLPNGADKSDLVAAFRVMKNYALKRIPNIVPLKTALEVFLGRIVTIMELVLTYVYGVYYALLGLLFVQVLGPVATFSEEALFIKRVSRIWRSALLIAFLFLPIVTAWLLLGVASAVGLVVSDACMVFADYRRHLLGINIEGLKPMVQNPLIQSGLTCIDPAQASLIKNGLQDALEPLKQPVFAQTVNVILNVSTDDLIRSAEHSAKSLSNLLDCNTLVDLSGTIEHIVCAAGGHSTVRAISDMWTAFLGLSITLSVTFLLSTLGVRVAWGAYVWPLPLVVKIRDDRSKVDEENPGLMDDEESIEAVMAVPPLA